MKRWLHRAIAVSLGLVLAAAGTGASWLAGMHIPFVSGATYLSVTKLHASYVARPDHSNGVMFMVFVGSDLRPGVGGARGDALHLLAINPALHQATIINVPRDTCAQVPGRGRVKINEANSVGGPALQANVIGALVGVPVTYSVEVDFAGFKDLVNGVGGVDLTIPFPMHDSYSNANFDPGPRHLDGVLALAFARDRHSFPTSDIQRSWNQGYLMIAAIRQLEHQYTSISGRFQLAALLARHAQLAGLGIEDLVRLGQIAGSVPADAIKSVTVPSIGGSCLTPSPSANALFADFRDDGVLETYPGGTPTNVSPSP